MNYAMWVLDNIVKRTGHTFESVPISITATQCSIIIGIASKLKKEVKQPLPNPNGLLS